MKACVARVLIAASVACAPAMLPALPITKTLTLQVYQVCDNGGLNCASTGPAGDTFFSTATNAIWAQAGISVLYNFVGQINSTNFSFINDNVAGKRFQDLAAGYHFQSTTVVDMFLVHSASGAYGEGWYGRGGLVLGMDAILAYAAGGRIDTMAHELGHNFGLVDPLDPHVSTTDPGHSTNPNELMAGGGIRSVPLTVADINPNGSGYDLVTAYQVAFARKSSLLHDVVAPEPSTFVLMAVGVLGVVVIRRRRVGSTPA